MSTSDLISLLGIGLAVWALIPSEQKRFVLLFFSKTEITTFALLLLFLHYLLAFEWLRVNWFPGLNRFCHHKGIPSEYYAYGLSILMMMYPIWKVNFRFFSESRIKQLLDLYRTLLSKKKYSTLERQIERYHLDDIYQYLVKYSALETKADIDIILQRTSKHDIEYNKILKNKRYNAAAQVYYKIIQENEFTTALCLTNPGLLAKILSGIQSRNAVSEDFAKFFLKTLFENRSQQLWREIKQLANSTESIVAQNDNHNLELMFAFFNNTKVANYHSLWYPIGEATIHSIITDQGQWELLQKDSSDSGLEEEFKNSKIWISVEFFNYMVRESIYRDSEWHMHLFYYHYYVEKLLDKSNVGLTKNYLFRSIEIILDNIYEWLKLSIDLVAQNRYLDSLKCLHQVITLLIVKHPNKASDSLITDSLEKIIDLHLSLLVNGAIKKKNLEAQKYFLKTNLEFMLSNQNILQGLRDEQPIPNFNDLLIKSWEDKVDKVPYEVEGLAWTLEEFEKDVIEKLN